MSQKQCKFCNEIEEYSFEELTNTLNDFFSTFNLFHDTQPIKDSSDFKINWTPDEEPERCFFTDVYIPFRLPVSTREITLEEEINTSQDESEGDSPLQKQEEKRPSIKVEESISFSELQLNSLQSKSQKRFYVTSNMMIQELLGKKIMELRNKISKHELEQDLNDALKQKSQEDQPNTERVSLVNPISRRESTSLLIRKHSSRLRLNLDYIRPIKLVDNTKKQEPLSKEEKEIEDLIEWQRSQKVRKARRLLNHDSQETNELQSEISTDLKPYTYTSTGRKKSLQQGHLPAFHTQRLPTLDFQEGAHVQVTKRPLPKVKMRVRSRQQSETSSQEATRRNFYQDFSQQKIFDEIELEDGVTYIEKERVKFGCKTERTMQEEEIIINQMVSNFEIKGEAQKLETINEDSRETSNLLNTMELATQHNTSRIYRTVNQSELSELLSFPENKQDGRKSLFQVFKNPSRNQNELSWRKQYQSGLATERNLVQKKAFLFPKITKYSPRRQKAPVLERLVMNQSTSQQNLKKSRFPFIKQSRNTQIVETSSLEMNSLEQTGEN